MFPEARDGILLALDPGLRYPAGAVFAYGKLVAAARVPIPTKLSRLDEGARIRAIADLVIAWYAVQTEDYGIPDWFVCEKMQVYRTGRQGAKGDPNDLLPLAFLGGYVAALTGCCHVACPTPAEWLGGQTPKATSGDPFASPRGQRVWNRLDAAERAAIIPSHDSIDAAGIGLWALQRFERLRVYPGAT